MSVDQKRLDALGDTRSVVVKCGTSSLTESSGRLDPAAVSKLCAQLAKLMDSGRSVTLVASGAIGAGMGELDLPHRPETLPVLQAVAAVGQGQLMRAFHDEMEKHSCLVGQVLVDREDFEDRRRYLNIRNTLFALHERNILPVINENDVVSVDEIRFGDNDIIAAHITNMLSADVLILLTTVDGILDAEKTIDTVHDIAQVRLLVSGDKSRLGSGGMDTKLAAAEMVTSAGEAAVIANIAEDDILDRIVSGESIGTFFIPADKRLSSRRRWIGQAARAAGSIIVDEGAVRALKEHGKSLLPSGITAVDGEFSSGEIVSVLDSGGNELARGLTNYDSRQLKSIMGMQTSEIAGVIGDKPYDEAIHRNNMTLC